MEAFDLQLVKLNVEVLNEILEDIATLTHKLGCLLVSQYL